MRSPRRSRRTRGRPLARAPARGLAAAQAAGGDRRGQQSAAAPRRRSATAATPALSDVLVDLRVDDHEQPIAGAARGSTRCTTGSSAGPRARTGCRSRAGCAPRSTSGSRGSATTRSTPGRVSRTSRSGSTATNAIDPVVLEALREAKRMSDGYTILTLDEVEAARAPRQQPHPGPAHARLPPGGRQRMDRRHGRAADPAARGGQRQRGAVRRRARARDVHGRRGGGGRTRRNARLRAAAGLPHRASRPRTARSSSSWAARSARRSTPAAGTRSPSRRGTGRQGGSTRGGRSWQQLIAEKPDYWADALQRRLLRGAGRQPRRGLRAPAPGEGARTPRGSPRSTSARTPTSTRIRDDPRFEELLG